MGSGKTKSGMGMAQFDGIRCDVYAAALSLCTYAHININTLITLLARSLRAGLAQSTFRAPTSSKASGRMTRGMVSAFAYSMAELDTRDRGPTTCSTGRGNSPRPTGRRIQGNGSRARETEWGSPSGPTAIDMRANSEPINPMGMVNFITATEMSTMESGGTAAATGVAIASFLVEMTIRQWP